MNEKNKSYKNNLAPNTQHITPYQENEINLLDLYKIIIRQKKWIIAITVLFTLAATLYSFTTPRVYRTEVILSPPSLKDIEKLNITQIYEINESTIFNNFVKNLNKTSLQIEYFRENKLNKFAIKIIGNNPIKVTVDGGIDDSIDDILNGFIAFINNYTINDQVENIKIASKKELYSTQKYLDEYVTRKKVQQRDNIVDLTKQLKIAKKLDIIDPSISVPGLPAYFRGTRALQAEIEIARADKDSLRDDALIIELKDKLKELDNMANVDTSQIKTVTIDKFAEPPQQPIKPQIQIIIFFGALAGLMFGIFVGFLKNFIEQHKQNAQ